VKKRYLALIIEDDADLSFIFSEALRLAGLEVEPIRDGGKALARLAEVEPALIVLDMHLPHLSGMNVLRQIHSEPRLLNTRVIIATADAAIAEELHNKADVVLLKPLSPEQLVELAWRLVPGAKKFASDAAPSTSTNSAPVTDSD